MFARSRLFAFGLMAAALSAAACSKPVDLKQSVQVADASAGWFDAGIEGGKNKLVPSVTFRLRKNPDIDLSSLSLNLVFMTEGAQEHFDDVFVQRVEFNGNETEPVTVRSKFGYTGEPPQSRADMLKNSQFRDMNVQVFAKQSSSQWTELHRLTIPRTLLTR
jgi:hypothetical protein